MRGDSGLDCFNDWNKAHFLNDSQVLGDRDSPIVPVMLYNPAKMPGKFKIQAVLEFMHIS